MSWKRNHCRKARGIVIVSFFISCRSQCSAMRFSLVSFGFSTFFVTPMCSLSATSTLGLFWFLSVSSFTVVVVELIRYIDAPFHCCSWHIELLHSLVETQSFYS